MYGEGEDGDAVSVGGEEGGELEDDALSAAEGAGELVDDEEDVGEYGVLRGGGGAGMDAGDTAHRAYQRVCAALRKTTMSGWHAIDEGGAKTSEDRLADGVESVGAGSCYEPSSLL